MCLYELDPPPLLPQYTHPTPWVPLVLNHMSIRKDSQKREPRIEQL